MKRQVILLLEHPTEADHTAKWSRINTLLEDAGITSRKFSFSANVGEYGGFVTEDEDVFKACIGPDVVNDV